MALPPTRDSLQSSTLQLITQTWHATLLLLAFMLPFELRAPWLDVGGALVFTNVELLMLVTLSLWGARQVILGKFPRWRASKWFGLALASLLLIAWLASIFAPSDNVNAFKVTARYTIGAVVCWLVVEATHTGLSGRRVLLVGMMSSIIVALLAILEINSGPFNAETIQQWLRPFRAEVSFRVGGEARASSTLAYPTITAMYLEMVFFFAIGWLAQVWSQRRRWQSLLLIAVLFLLSEALILTWTRSALIAIFLTAPAIVIVRWPRVRLDNFARATLIATGVMGLLLLSAIVIKPQMQLRLLSESDRNWYRAAYDIPPLPPLHTSETITIPVTLRNVGQRDWEAQGANAVYLLYHWLSADGKQMVVAESQHKALPHSVKPGQMIQVDAQVLAPSQAGDYILALDMLRDGLFWFSVLGAPMLELSVKVTPGEFVPPVSAVGVPNSLASLDVDRLTLWRAALQMLAAHPLLGIGSGNFRLELGPYLNTPEWDHRLHANNTYLEMFADSGVLGGTTFLLLVFVIAHASWRVLHLHGTPTQLIYGATLVAALSVFFVHAVTDYFLEFTPTYLLFWLTLGLLMAHLADGARSRT